MAELSNKESERLRNLYSYNILDSEGEFSFDKITKIASQICDTPISLISLLDSDRQWFKSRVGLSAESTPRSVAFCHYTIQGNDVMEVKNATDDERFRSNPLVTGDPNIRFYAGAPLKTPEGYNLGTLCVIDTKEKKLTNEQLEILKMLADQVVELIVLHKTNRDLKKAKDLLEQQQGLIVTKTRLESIGELAGGVCHQINNPLAIIVGRSMILRSQLKEKLPGDGEVQRELEVIEETSQRVSGILKALRSYAKDMGNTVSKINLEELVQDVKTLTTSKTHHLGVSLEVSTTGPIYVTINRNQISQAILELVNNSLESLESADVRTLKIELKEAGSDAVLTVSDSGSGISKDAEGKVFDTFFSTKSRHFGVGLSNARNFVEQNKGKLELLKSSRPVTFKMTLPKAS